MADLSDIDDGDSIDWNEAIAISQAAETARLEQASVAPPLKQLVPPSTSVDNLISPTDEDILFLYDLIDANQYILVNDDGQDIEDLGMKQSLRPAARTLFEQFRKRRGFLSVTDLTAPSGWCEVQYAYSLVGRRDLKPEKRPETIVTATGTEIKVNKKLAILHEKTLEKGRQTDSNVDRWGLRFLNQIVSLVTLRDAGKAREIPIFGFFNEVFVMGVMDEIEKRPLPDIGDTSKDKKIDSTTNATKKITDFFKTSTPIIRKPTHGYYLVDSKTRAMPYLPKKEYTIASRNQLMLYRYLFNKHATDSFDWNGLWKHIKLNPEDSLSSSFLDQIKVICMSANLEDMLDLNTLGQLAEYLRDLHLEIGSLQDQLELVYRWRGSSHSKPRRTRSRGARKETTPAGRSGGESDDTPLQAAIAASLEDNAGTAETPISLDDDVPMDTNAPMDDSGMFVDDPAQEVVRAETTSISDAMQEASLPSVDTDIPQPASSNHILGSGKSPSSTPMDVWEIANKAEIISAQEEGSIIGTEKFLYKEDDMMEYVQNTLAFWNGREPKGVRLDETNKCRTCEFQDGCEWLALKAEEHRLRAREKRMAREAS